MVLKTIWPGLGTTSIRGGGVGIATILGVEGGYAVVVTCEVKNWLTVRSLTDRGLYLLLPHSPVLEPVTDL